MTAGDEGERRSRSERDGAPVPGDAPAKTKRRRPARSDTVEPPRDAADERDRVWTERLDRLRADLLAVVEAAGANLLSVVEANSRQSVDLIAGAAAEQARAIASHAAGMRDLIESARSESANLVATQAAHLLDLINRSNADQTRHIEATASQLLDVVARSNADHIRNIEANAMQVLDVVSKAKVDDLNRASLADLRFDALQRQLEESRSSALRSENQGTSARDETRAGAESVLALVGENFRNVTEVLGERLQAFAQELEQRDHRLLEVMMRQRRHGPARREPGQGLPAPIRLRNPLPLGEAFARLRELAPDNVDAYLSCLEAGTRSYEGFPVGSCSTERHPEALLFAGFLRPYLAGRVLDIGCGPQPTPSYLADWPADRIAGVDPISTAADHPFLFVPAIGEFLPFEDETFETVVSGTTLDHYYLLDRGLQEAFRVLAPGGYFVAWIAEFQGAPAYDPYSRPLAPYDREHMYHIDRSWFLPLIERTGFETAEIIAFQLPFRYLFMSFHKPGPRAP